MERLQYHNDHKHIQTPEYSGWSSKLRLQCINDSGGKILRWYHPQNGITQSRHALDVDQNCDRKGIAAHTHCSLENDRRCLKGQRT